MKKLIRLLGIIICILIAILPFIFGFIYKLWKSAFDSGKHAFKNFANWIDLL